MNFFKNFDFQLVGNKKDYDVRKPDGFLLNRKLVKWPKNERHRKPMVKASKLKIGECVCTMNIRDWIKFGDFR
jgi:hypothetical protein